MNFLCVLTKVNKFPFELEISKRSFFCQKVRCSSKKRAKKQKIKLCTVIGGKFKISAQDSDLAHYFEPSQTLLQKTKTKLTFEMATSGMYLGEKFESL